VLGEDELRSLMLAGLAGDSDAYRTLLEALRTRLRAYYRRRLGEQTAEAEDLVQESLIALHTRRATYDPAQPVTAWVYAIARYKLVDHYRRTGRRRDVPLDVAEEIAVDDESEAVHARRDLERGLADLPQRTRELLRSVKLDGTPVAEVAARAGMSEGAVKVAVHRGLTRLAARLRSRKSGGGEP
jgi:RNA polymerase sigma-70 factor (ECF subfamily)